MRVDGTVLSILGMSTVNGRLLVLPEQLERTLYMKVAKALEAAGWRWNRKVKGHECQEEDGVSKLEQLMLTGEVTHARQEFDFFETPQNIVEMMIEHAIVPDLWHQLEVLEPSAGTGRIAKAAAARGARVTAYEIQPLKAQTVSLVLHKRGTCMQRDFLGVPPIANYDRVLMNPPFSKQQDIAHVTHALKFVRPGGMLISIMSPGFTFRSDRKTREFNELLDAQTYREVVALPQHSFKESGTLVNTVMVKVIV